MLLSEEVRLLEELEDYSRLNQMRFWQSTDYMLIDPHFQHLQDLGELVLVLAGEKPAMIIDTVIPPWKDATVSLLNAIELPYKKEEHEQGTRARQYAIYATKDLNWLERIVAARRSSGHLELGRCFGYPETAIQAYLGKRERFAGVVAERLPISSVTSFACSADFWLEEREVLERWDNVLSTLSPKLYHAVKTHRNS